MRIDKITPITFALQKGSKYFAVRNVREMIFLGKITTLI